MVGEYMTITEVSQKFDMTPDTLRYYERIGLIPPVNRTPGGIRDYSEIDCNWIEFIKCMRDAGLPVRVLVKYVSLFQEGDITLEARKSLLIEQRDSLTTKIEAMQSTLDRLNVKIKRYEDLMVPVENELINSLR